MIYTLTLNPSIDYVVRMDEYKEGIVNRTSSEALLYGGKGINTSVVLANLGVENIALGFTGGYIGEEFEALLHNDGVKTDFVKLKNGNTRINVKIKAQAETEINAKGPDISTEELENLLLKLDNIQAGDYITLAGSVPPSIPADIYIRIAEKLSRNGVNIIVDAEKNLLTEVLPYKPFLIKPNHHELAEIFGRELMSKEEIISAAKELQKMGARNVLVSMAGDGGIFVGEDNAAYFSPAPTGKVINSTGAGDSTVAGFLAEYIRSANYKKAFIYGLCAGSASAFSEKLATKNEINNLLNTFLYDKIETM